MATDPSIDDSSESDAASGADSFFPNEQVKANSLQEIFRFFHKSAQQLSSKVNNQGSHSSASEGAPEPGVDLPSRESAKPRHPNAWSRYRLQPPVLTPEEHLEKLMGRIFQVGFIADIFAKEIILTHIIEFLSKPQNEHLRAFRSNKFNHRTVMEIALDNNVAGILDNQIKALKSIGCTYHPRYETKLPINLRRNNLLAAVLDEPISPCNRSRFHP